MTIHTGNTDVTPEEVGFDPQHIEFLDDFFAEMIQTEKMQAAGYLLSRRGKIFAWKSMGRLNAFEDKGDFLPNSIRPIASITKIFTATGIMQLVQQGKIVLEQPMSSIIDEFTTPLHERITIFHLLTHTSGLATEGGMLEPYPRNWWPEDMTRENWIKMALEGPLESPVGTTWSYCNRGFHLLAEVIARVSGMPYDEYIRKHILDPLSITSSFFEVPEEHKDYICAVTEWDQKRVNWIREEDGKDGTPSWWGAGGLYSTPHDLWKFGQMFLDKGTFNGTRILRRKSVEAMTRLQLKDIPSYNWGTSIKDKQFGLGWQINKDLMLSPGSFSHEGAGRCGLYIDPVEQIVFVYIVPTTVEWEQRAMCGARSIVWAGIG